MTGSRTRRLLFPILAAHLIFPALWLAVLLQAGPRQNDWRHFQVAAEQFVSGAWSDLYTTRWDSVHPGYFWRYPPYALYVVAPLAWLTPVWAYYVLAAIEIVALAGSMVLLARLRPIRDLPAWTVAIALSAPALSTIITGQISGLILLCVVGAAFLWREPEGREVRATNGGGIVACALLGLLAFKPNIGIFFGLFVIARREWRGAAAMVAVVLLLCASTLPLGMTLWSDFFRISATNLNLISDYEPYKMITLKAFLEAILSKGRVADTVWFVSIMALLGASVWAWRKPAPILSHLGLVVLLALATNPYGFFYDALLLVVPATAWWTERDTWRRDRWTLVGVLITIAWCWEQYSYNWQELVKPVGVNVTPPFSIVGPVAAVWLLVASAETVRASSKSPTTESILRPFELGSREAARHG